jgi:hypothetical protein
MGNDEQIVDLVPPVPFMQRLLAWFLGFFD